ncbi:MAG: DUF177 domain-containing protein [Gaiellaceae bacterium]|jgi:uncharacterized protein
MTTFDLRRLRLRSGEEHREAVEIELEPLVYGGQSYLPVPETIVAELAISRASSGTVFGLRFESRMIGPCYRCLSEAEFRERIVASEYQDADPNADEELLTPYLERGRLDLSAWARDAVALALPETILCRPDCAGLCSECGLDLNREPHTHQQEHVDSRWEALEKLRNEL